MDAIVQLIRNALCCIKDLNMFEGTFIHDKVLTGQLLGKLPEPMDQTSPLELIISITQLYACVSLFRSGITLITTSVGKLRRILRIVEARMTNLNQQNQQQEEKKKNDDDTAAAVEWTQADRIVHESLFKEAKHGLRSVFIGFLVTPLGICFWWLFINSWHITEVDWFGGLQGLINALTVMEIVLVPLLYYMIVDGFETLRKSNRAKDLLQRLQSGSLTKSEDIDVLTYESMTGWVPFWDAGTPMFSGPTPDEEQRVAKEVAKVKETLTTWFPSKGEKKDDDDKVEKEEKMRQEALDDAEYKLEVAVPTLRMEGYREFVYFILNFVAFYGYLMGPITHYYKDEEVQPYHIQSMKFFYRNDDADWHGNFAGDLMWTIEPIIILGSPVLFALFKPSSKKSSKEKKVKAD